MAVRRRAAAGSGKKRFARTPVGVVRYVKSGMDGKVKKCGAYARSSGLPCRAKGLGRGGRCRLHGGASTGPKTAEGAARSLAARRAAWEAQRPAQVAHLRNMWTPALLLKQATAFNETLRRRDIKKVLARTDPKATWDWYYSRQGKRRARIEELRAQAEAAAVNARIAADLFGKRQK